MAKCVHGMESYSCHYCLEKMLPHDVRYTFQETQWGIEILKNCQPIYSFRGDEHFRLNRGQVELGLMCKHQLWEFYSGTNTRSQIIKAGNGDLIGLRRHDGYIYFGKWKDEPYLAIVSGRTDVKLQVGMHKSYAFCCLTDELEAWLREGEPGETKTHSA